MADEKSKTDDLTKIYNRRYFFEILLEKIESSRIAKSFFYLIIFDIDHFKGINDTYGHSFGAFTIAQTGKLIKTATEHRGLASRFGGDEFMVFIPNVNIETARQIAETIRLEVEAHPFVMEGITLGPTISVGVSDLKKDDTMASLFKRADEALYQSKRTGRNKVSVVT